MGGIMFSESFNGSWLQVIEWHKCVLLPILLFLFLLLPFVIIISTPIYQLHGSQHVLPQGMRSTRIQRPKTLRTHLRHPRMRIQRPKRRNERRLRILRKR